MALIRSGVCDRSQTPHICGVRSYHISHPKVRPPVTSWGVALAWHASRCMLGATTCGGSPPPALGPGETGLQASLVGPPG